MCCTGKADEMTSVAPLSRNTPCTCSTPVGMKVCSETVPLIDSSLRATNGSAAIQLFCVPGLDER